MSQGNVEYLNKSLFKLSKIEIRITNFPRTYHIALVELITLYASTGVGSGALSVRFTRSFANWLALVVVYPFVAGVTVAVIRTRTHSVHAYSLADWLAGVHGVAE